MRGKLYTDGSVVFPAYPSFCAGGWAVVQMQEPPGRGPECMAACHGQVPCEDLDSTACELYALFMALRRFSGPACVFVDSEVVLRSIDLGRAYCVAADNKYARVWRQVWHKLEDIGPGIAQLARVKAHSSPADVHAGRISHIDWQGNAWADKLAKLEARRAGPWAEQVALVDSWHRRQATVCRWIGQAAC